MPLWSIALPAGDEAEAEARGASLRAALGVEPVVEETRSGHWTAFSPGDGPPRFEVRVWVEARPPESVLARIRESCGGGEPEVRAVEEEDWSSAWKRVHRAVVVGGLTVAPPWFEFAGAPGTLLRIEPGLAFGLGDHPSTRLALRALLGALKPGDRVLDVGCGSGILALAALRAGAAEALGIDVDPEAAAAARRNAELNDLGDRLALRIGGPAAVSGAFDLVVANIVGEVLVDLLPDLAARLASGGRLVLAGLLGPQRERLRRALATSGELEIVESLEEEGFEALVSRRPAEGP